MSLSLDSQYLKISCFVVILLRKYAGKSKELVILQDGSLSQRL